MSKHRGYYVLLLAKLLTGVSSVSVISKYVCIGESILMFHNLTFSSLKTTLSLYKTVNNKTQLIARWSIPKYDNYPSPLAPYKNRLVFDDKSGIIFLEHFRRSDEATFFIKYDINGVQMTDYVKIIALVAPEENCRPKIQPNKENTTLSATVETSVCGRPPLSIQWQNSSGISYITSTAIKLPVGKEAGTYSAYMDGLALACVKNATKLNYCSNYTIEEKKHPPLVSSESLDQTKWWPCLLIIITIMIVAAIIIVIQCRKIKKRRSLALHKLLKEALLRTSRPDRRRTTDTSQGDAIEMDIL